MDPPVPPRAPFRGRARGRPLGQRPDAQTQPPSSLPLVGELNISDQPESPSEPQVKDEPQGQGYPEEAPSSSGPAVDPHLQEDKETWRKVMAKREYLVTKPPYLTDKRGTVGGPMQNLVSNYFTVQLKGNREWKLRQYQVDFSPDQDNSFIRKVLLRKQKEVLPQYIFDGRHMMYSVELLETNPTILTSNFVLEDKTEVPYTITIKHTRDLPWDDTAVFQFYNTVVKWSLSKSDLSLMGRFYFDHNLSTALPAHRLEIWPGYKTVMRPYEHRILLNVEMVSKVIRMDTVLKIMYQIRDTANRDSIRSDAEAEICGRVVMTKYNRKTYSVDTIVWNAKVTDAFAGKDGPITYVEYYKTKYGITIQELNQPLLMAKPRKRDIHREGNKDIILVPELCQLTGLTEAMRSDFKLMGAMKDQLFLDPNKRASQIQNFMTRLAQNTELASELFKWGIKYNTTDMVSVPGRRLEGEPIAFGNGQTFRDSHDPSDWTKAFRSHQLFNPVPLKTWTVIVSPRDSQNVDNLARTIKNVSTPLAFLIDRPTVKTSGGQGAMGYIRAIDEVMAECRGRIDLIFVILGNNNLQTYAAVKKKCAVDYGVSSQCFLAKNALKANMSVCTKVAIQMCAKLGGEPWTVPNPLSKAKLMVVGYDVHHSGGPAERKNSVGAMVASLNGAVTKYTSSVKMAQKTELSSTIGTELLKLVRKYEEVNGELPGRIIFYRDGVGEGQLAQVQDVEITGIEGCLASCYETRGLASPKFTFIVVSKRINTRLLTKSPGRGGFEFGNPPPGTIVDDVVTLPERYDFYLISQTTRQGTVSPTSYNVIKDHPSLDPSKLQMFTYKMCHLYFNWSGTVAVPAVCQYAHKLAYLTGLALNSPANSNLSNLLHFL